MTSLVKMPSANYSLGALACLFLLVGMNREPGEGQRLRRIGTVKE